MVHYEQNIFLFLHSVYSVLFLFLLHDRNWIHEFWSGLDTLILKEIKNLEVSYMTYLRQNMYVI